MSFCTKAVNVSHVSSVSDFHVVYEDDMDDVIRVKQALDKFNPGSALDSKAVLLGNLVIVKDADKFHRAVVLSKGNRAGDVVVRAFLVDVGRQELVAAPDCFAMPTGDLDDLDPVRSTPPLSARCKLAVAPGKGGDDPGRAANDKFLELISSARTVELDMIEPGRDVDVVDLIITNHIGSFSVSEVLLRIGLCHLTHHHLPPLRPPSNDDSCFSQLSQAEAWPFLVPGSVHRAKVSCVHTPARMSIQLLDEGCTGAVLEKLLKDMNAFYSWTTVDKRTSSSSPHRVLWPRPGVAVAAFRPDSGFFFRAVIDEVLQGLQVRIRFVDTGEFAIASTTALSLLHPSFASPPALSVDVSVVGLEPPSDSDGRPWSGRALKRAARFARRKSVMVFVRRKGEREDGGGFTIGVSLFHSKTSESYEFTMIRKGLAKMATTHG